MGTIGWQLYDEEAIRAVAGPDVDLTQFETLQQLQDRLVEVDPGRVGVLGNGSTGDKLTTPHPNPTLKSLILVPDSSHRPHVLTPITKPLMSDL